MSGVIYTQHIAKIAKKRTISSQDKPDTRVHLIYSGASFPGVEQRKQLPQGWVVLGTSSCMTLEAKWDKCESLFANKNALECTDLHMHFSKFSRRRHPGFPDPLIRH